MSKYVYLLLSSVLLLGCEPAPAPKAKKIQALQIVSGEPVDKTRGVVFPQDHGAHLKQGIEWWYITANLTADTGERFGAQWTMFRTLVPLPFESTWWDNQLYFSHFALQHEQSHVAFERFARAGQASITASPFAAHLDDWSLKSTQQSFLPLQMRAKQDDYAIDVSLSNSPLTLHGDNGYRPVKPYNNDLVDYLSNTVSPSWDLISCIKRGVAFHHGAMPRHIQDLVVDEFNDRSDNGLSYLFCTTSLTEGINSAAKNVVIYDKKVGNGDLLKTLDRKNIEGRAGRFMQHFIGRVFHLETQEDNDSETVVEIEYLDNKDPAIETLIQLDHDDIPHSKLDIIQKHTDDLSEIGVDPSTIKENKFVKVDGQIELINHLRQSNNLDNYYFREQLPVSECLDNILSCSYEYLFTDHDKGRSFNTEVGKSILLGLTKFYIYYSPSFKQLLSSSTVQNQRKNDNSRIRYVFDLMSKYFEFSWPKYLKTFANIYNFVAVEKSQPKIALDMVIAKLEYGTTENHEIILRDSGLPNEVVKKISHYFKGCDSYEDIYKVNRTKSQEINRSIHPIERKILDKYI